MIKVLRIGNRFNLGGPTYNMAYLTKYLGADYETLLIGGPHEQEEASSDFILDRLGIQPTIIPEMQRSINFKNDKAAFLAIRKVIREFKPDIVHTHASKAGAVGRLAAKTEGVTAIVHTFHGHVFHSYFGRFKTLFYKVVERYLAKHSTAIIAISKQQKHELASVHKICAASKIEVVRLGFDLEKFDQCKVKQGKLRSNWNLGDRALVGIIGRLVPIKNHKLFLKSVQLAKKLGANFTAVVVGDGELKTDLLDYCTEIGLSNSTDATMDNSNIDVVFTSWIKNVEEVYADLSLSCLTSLNEGTPVSIIESLASRVPVISTNVGGVRDIVEEGKSGLLFSSLDDEGIAQGLVKLLSNPNELQQMGQFGNTTVLTEYSYLRLTSDIRALYSQLLRGNK